MRVARPRFEPDLDDPLNTRDKLYAELRNTGEKCRKLSDCAAVLTRCYGAAPQARNMCQPR